MLPTPPASPSPPAPCSSEDQVGLVLAGSIQLIEVIGVGAYGTVYLGRHVATNASYAVKALPKVGLDPRQKKFQDREIQLHYRASQHPNVVSLLKIMDSPDYTYVVMEYCKEGDLFASITEERHYNGDDRKAKQVFLQILDAVQHCHAQGIYHRDLKPENVLVENDGWTVKLADFGLATQDRITSDYGCGSTFYMSPECQQPNPKPYSTYASAPNDVWSLGVILVNLTCGRNPWKRASMEDSTFRAFVRDRNFLRTILPISDDLNYILKRIFETNPHRRIQLDELRDLVLRSAHWTTHAATTSNSAPLTPPYSPVEHAVDSPAAIPGYPSSAVRFEPVPQLDLLAAPQYPPSPSPEYDYGGSMHSCGVLTPGMCSPQPTSLYTSQAKSVAAVVPSGNFFGSLPDFRRCGQMFANFNVPPVHHVWPAF